MDKTLISTGDCSEGDFGKKRKKKRIKTVTMPKSSADSYENLIFSFKYAKITCSLKQDVFPVGTQEKVDQIVSVLSENIMIDRTYVNFNGTKYEKTFMSEEGWDSLCTLVVLTDYGKKASATESDAMFLSYKAMMACYVEDCFADLGWNTANMSFSVLDDKFTVEYWPDTFKEWKRYPGKWQTWPCNG